MRSNVEYRPFFYPTCLDKNCQLKNSLECRLVSMLEYFAMRSKTRLGLSVHTYNWDRQDDQLSESSPLGRSVIGVYRRSIKESRSGNCDGINLVIMPAKLMDTWIFKWIKSMHPNHPRLDMGSESSCTLAEA